MDEYRGVMRDATGAIVAEGGISLLFPGLGDAWMRLTPFALQTPIQLCKTIRRTALEARRQFTLHSLVALVDPADPVAVRFARRLGFTPAAAIPTAEGIRSVYMLDWSDAR